MNPDHALYWMREVTDLLGALGSILFLTGYTIAIFLTALALIRERK